MSANATDVVPCRCALDQGVLTSLMIPLPVVVLHVLRDRSSEVALADRNQPIEALLFN
jgi:hypothetical protein